MTSYNSSNPIIRAPEPTHEELFEDVAKARSRGVGNREKPLTSLPALLWAARIIGGDEPEIDDDEKIEYALRLAVARIGGKSARAMEALLGLSQQTRGLSAGTRRKKAVEIFERSHETFRVRFETPLLMAIATYLRVLVDERCLADREAELMIRLRAFGDSPEPQALESDEDWGTDGPGPPFIPFISQEELAELLEKRHRETYLQLF
jgi:hypothetical protein